MNPYSPDHPLRLWSFLISDQDARQEIIATYEAIYAGVEDEGIREEVRGLLGIFRQESLRVMQ